MLKIYIYIYTWFVFGLMMGDVTTSEKFLSSDGQQYLKKPPLFSASKKKEYFCGFFPHWRVFKKANKNEKTEK